jgi:hypothetical protein
MYARKDARELAILLRISRELDIVGDVTATVDNPSEILAWAMILHGPGVVAWRAHDSGHRYLTAPRDRAPVRGRITAVLDGDQHRTFWAALGLDGLGPGERRDLTVEALSAAWASLPVSPPDAGAPSAPQPPHAAPR